MNSNYFVIGYIVLVLLYGLIKKVTCFNAFINGVKEGTVTVMNMFSYLLAFVFLLEMITSCGILEDLQTGIFSETFSPILLVQMLMRPFSGSSSSAMMLGIFESSGVDSFEGLVSSFIHTMSDSSVYMIVFYFGAVGIRKYKNVIWLGILLNVIGFLFSILAAKIILS